MLNNVHDLLLVSKKESEKEVYHEVLESITFDKTQMFWLPVKPAPDVKIDITFKSNNTSETQCLIGGRINASGSNRKMFAFWECVGGSSSTSGYMRADFGNSSTASNDIGLSSTLTDFRNFVKDGADNYIDGTQKASNTGVLEEDTNNTYIALGCMSNGTVSSYSLSNPFSGDVAQLKIWKAGTQVADYVPVLDNKMQPCLYNRITKEFLYAKVYPSGSTTTYNLGFKRWNKFDVDYIESTGTQYIDTGYKFTNTSAFEITCAEAGNFESSTVLCGARNNTDTTTNARIVDYSYSAPSVLRGEYLLLQRGGYDVNENVIYIPYDKEFHTYYQSPTRMSIDDTERPTVPSLVSPNMSFYIFWQNVGTATAPAKAKIKVKNCKLWDNGTLVRDYKPVVWHNSNTTAVACMYDEVYNKMYQNAGTGSFKAYIIGKNATYEVGKSVSGTPSSSVLGVSNCFDTGLYGTQNTTVKYFAIGYDSNTTAGQLFGSYDGTTSTSQNLTINSTGTGNTAPIRFDGQVITTAIKIPLNQFASIVTNKYGLWVNDSLHESWGNVNDFTTLTTMLILKCNNSTNTRNNGCCYCAIYESDKLIAEYIPVRNASNSTEFGLYDTVDKALNTGVGTLNFNELD